MDIERALLGLIQCLRRKAANKDSWLRFLSFKNGKESRLTFGMTCEFAKERINLTLSI